MALVCRTNTADRLSSVSLPGAYRRSCNSDQRRSVSRSSSKCKLNDLISEILEKRKARCSTAGLRCRPRLRQLQVLKCDGLTKKKTRVDVGYLQDYSDRLRALRELISIQFETRMSEVYTRLDYSGTGMISVTDLEAGLKFLCVPWQQVTGLTRMELYDLMDPEKTGSVDILDFLGLSVIPESPVWADLDLVDQWDSYCSRVTESLILDSSGFAKKSIKSVLKNISPDSLQTSIHRIEDCLRDYNENKRGMAKLRMEFQAATEAEEKRLEQQRNREEIEARKKLIKAEAGKALLGNGDHTIFKSSIRGFERPSDDELINYFQRQNPTLLTEEELEYRNFLSDLKIPLPRGDVIRKAFFKYTNGVLDETGFNNILKELTNADLQGYWTSFNTNFLKNRDADSGLFIFIEWFNKHF